MPKRLAQLVLTALISALLLLAAATAASAASQVPLEGTFENCPLAIAMGTCLQRLQVMQQGGMNVVVFSPKGDTLPELEQYATAAHALGMSIMWSTSDPGFWQQPTSVLPESIYFAAFAQACGCSQNGQILSYMIRWLSALPATYGYYAADDSVLSPGDGAAIAGYVAAIKAADPNHTVMIAAAQQSEANAYVHTADLVGDEVYPVTSSSLMPAGQHLADWQSVQQSASDEQRAANSAGKQSAFILQAFTFGDNLSDGEAVGACTAAMSQLLCYHQLQYPSPAAQLQLRNEILEHAHPKLLLWWSFQGTYGQVGNDLYSIFPTGATAASRWAGLSAAVRAPLPVSASAASARKRSRRARELAARRSA